MVIELKNEKVTVQFKEFGSVPRHGLVRKKNFRFEQLRKDSVVFTIIPDKEMLMQYPYHFE